MDIDSNNRYGQCRCCLGVGNQRDFMKEYFTNGIREVYFDIFKDCFNLLLSTNDQLTNLICSSCIQRLRDASTFRMMVVSTERQLLSKLTDKSTVFVNVLQNNTEIDHNVNVDIKVEDLNEDYKYETEENNSDYTFNDVDEFSEYDDEDNVPLARKSTKFKKKLIAECLSEDSSSSGIIAKHEIGDVTNNIGIHDEKKSRKRCKKPLISLVQGEQEFLSRFPSTPKALPTRDSLYTLCYHYVTHLDALKGKVIEANIITKIVQDSVKKQPTKKLSYCMSEKAAQISNASLLLEYSNITPFRSKNRYGYPCFYCRKFFENIDKIRVHQSEHKKSDMKRTLSTYGAESLIIYVDITDMRCKICNQSMSTLSDLKKHLVKVHNKKYHIEFNDRIIPYKLSETGKDIDCQLCGFTFQTFGSIERHMNVHFRNYVCKECGSGFVTKYRMKVHCKNMHAIGSFPCDLCQKVFTSQQKYKSHVDTVHNSVKRFKCPKCAERFTEYFRRQRHMVEVHGVAPLEYKCNVCDRTFDRKYSLSRHMKRDHLEERDFQCELCAYKCFTNIELRVHMVKHNGERIFECSVCKKSYARKKTLREHMRIHNNDRRFSCAVCGQAFVQKCSLKGHLKTHHLEYTMQ